MPYPSNVSLPKNIKGYLPSHAQDIYRAAFNSAWIAHKGDSDEEREEAAHAIAWSAVKKQYHKSDSGEWIKNK